MRILHIIPYFYPAWAYGGTCRAAWEVARATARRGHDVVVCTTDALDARRRAEPPSEVVEGIEIHRSANLSNRLAWNRLFLPLTFEIDLARELGRTDVVHVHEYRSFQNVVALPAIERAGKPFILTAQGSAPLLLGRFALKRVYDALVGKRLITQACRLHALNTMEQKQFLEAGGLPEQIFIAPNCINVDEYHTLPQSNDFRAKHDIAPGAPLALFLARINKIKGVDFLVSAFAEALSELPEAVLVVAGPDDGFLPQVKEQIQTLGISERVRFVGYIDGAAKLEAFQAADVYVLPSTYEILGITLLEALACRTPVITTEQCGLADEIQQNRLGSVVGYGDVSGLKDELVRTLCNRETMRRDAERRREYVLVNFSWDTVAEKWEAVYAECAASRRK